MGLQNFSFGEIYKEWVFIDSVKKFGKNETEFKIGTILKLIRIHNLYFSSFNYKVLLTTTHRVVFKHTLIKIFIIK